MDEILILAETKETQIEKSTHELIQAGRELKSALGGILSCLLLGEGMDGAVKDLEQYPLDRIYLLENPLLKDFSPDLWVSSLEQAVRNLKPKVFIMAHSPTGREVGPRLSARLKSTLTTDCIGLRLDPEDRRIVRVKPIYGGNAVAVLKGKGNPELITLRKNVYSPAAPEGTKTEIIKLQLALSDQVVKVKALRTIFREQVELDKAEVIISGGRGIGAKEDFQLLERLAELINQRGIKALVGCSRPVVDKGWLSSDHQVGLTGTMVAPGLYVAVGISGAIQHLVGMVRSKKIVAINTDPNCNMFKVADYGVIEDYKEILHHLISKLEGLS